MLVYHIQHYLAFGLCSSCSAPKNANECKRVNTFCKLGVFPSGRKVERHLCNSANQTEVAWPRDGKIANPDTPNQADAFLPSHLRTESSVYEISNFNCHLSMFRVQDQHFRGIPFPLLPNSAMSKELFVKVIKKGLTSTMEYSP